VDAIVHVLEYYFDGSACLIHDRISEALVRTIMEMTEILIEDPKNYEARANLAWSATLALNGLTEAGSRGGDWASHAIEHPLSALYDIAHGAGLAIVFPAWMRYVYRENIEKFERFSKEIFGLEGSGEDLVLSGIEKFKTWLRKVGAPISLKDAGIPEEDIEKIADNARMKAPLGKLKKLYREDIVEILKLAAR